MTDYLTTAEASQRLGCSPQFVRSLIARGYLPGAYEPIGPGRGWLIPAASVSQRLRRHKKNGPNKGGRPRKFNDDKDLKNLEKSASKSR